MSKNDPRTAASAFALPGPVESVSPYGSGHINDSYLVVCGGSAPPPRFILQRLNTDIFREPERLMENVERVTRHVRTKLEAGGVDDFDAAVDLDRRRLTLVPARDGRSFTRDGAGNVWRVYRFVEGATSRDAVTTPEEARQASFAFARFARLLSDLPNPRLHETIPLFHHTPSRFDALLDAVRRDPLRRVADARETVDAYLSREELASAFVAPLLDGRLTERVAHNDTKINNVLLDDATGEGICVIDLDTVMPGLFLHDFGDLVRTAVCPAAEDEPDTSRIAVELPLFSALVKGALDGLDGQLSPFERESLPLSGRLLTFECGSRFLTDHLLGDTYFKVHRPGQNLDRARAQLALLRSMEERADELSRAVEDAAGG